MIIKDQKEIVLTNTCAAVYDDRTLKEAMLWFATEPIASKKKVFMYGRYPAVAIRHHKLHIHRLIVAFLSGGIAKGDYVHHKDGNKLNNLADNLEIMSAEEHQRITNKGRKQSAEHIKRRTASMKKTRYENPDLLTPNL
jgi:hypothetical protein